jgi:hypothetical protein
MGLFGQPKYFVAKSATNVAFYCNKTLSERIGFNPMIHL